MTTENTTPVNPEPTTPTDKRSAAIAAMNAADPPEAPEGEAAPAEAAEPEAPKAKGKKPDDAEHEVKATEGVELKTKLRAKLAAAEAKEREIAQRRADMEAEIAQKRESVSQQERQFKEHIDGLAKLRRDDPKAFLKAIGMDLGEFNSVVKGILEDGKPEAVAAKKERELLERLERQEREMNEWKQTAAQRDAESKRQAVEQEFVADHATDAKRYPLLSRFAKNDREFMMQNAYSVSAQLQRENGGKLPEMSAIAERLEKRLARALQEDAAEVAITESDDFTNDPPVAAAKPKAKISPKSNAVPKSVKPVKEMTEREKRLAAIAAMQEFDLE